MENINQDLITILWLVIAAVGIGLLIAGASNKVVIYYDSIDMLISALAVFLPPIAIAMLDAYPFESSAFNTAFHWTIPPVTAIAGIACFIISFVKAIKHNHSLFLGLFIGVFKLAFVGLTILAILGQVAKIADDNSSFKDAAIAIIFISLFTIIAKAMINGPGVYAAKGWVLPAPEPSIS